MLSITTKFHGSQIPPCNVWVMMTLTLWFHCCLQCQATQCVTLQAFHYLRPPVPWMPSNDSQTTAESVCEIHLWGKGGFPASGVDKDLIAKEEDLGNSSVLFCTPESIVRSQWQEALEKLELSTTVVAVRIDEAHSVSKWWVVYKKKRCIVNSCINMDYSVVNVTLLFTGVMISGHHMDNFMKFSL